MKRDKADVVIAGFGDQWTRFDQTGLSDVERRRTFDAYFAVFPWGRLPPNAVGADIGCGSGRWALLAAPRLGTLHCVDPSDAIVVAERTCAHLPNVWFHRAGIENLPFADNSLDMAYSLGVVHHLADTAGAIRAIARKLKAGAPLLLYIYYAFDHRPAWFRAIWRTSDVLRRVITRFPYAIRYGVTQIAAALVYWPLARTAKVLEHMGILPSSFPLAQYRDRTFYTMRTAALDRLGTLVEHRFTKPQIGEMMRAAGLGEIVFSEKPPFWCAAGLKREAV
jgi:SAM-dependent methyltransferase